MPATPEVIAKALPSIPNSVNIHNASRLHIPILEPNSNLDVSTESLVFHDLKHAVALEEGDEFLKSHRIDSIAIVPPGIPQEFLAMAIEETVIATHPQDPHRQLIIATDDDAETIKSRLPNIPIVTTSQLQGLVKWNEAYTIYNVDEPPPSGFLHGGAAIVNQLIFRRNRGSDAEHIHVSTLGLDVTKVGASAVKYAAGFQRCPNAIMVGKNYGSERFLVGRDLTSDIARDITTQDLEPTNNYAVLKGLYDNVPLITGDGQDLITLITAYEYAKILRMDMVKILDAWNIKAETRQLLGEKEKLYDKLFRMVEEELHANKEYLSIISQERLKAFNQRLREEPRFGQLLPSLGQLLRDGMIDYNRVAELEKQMHKTQHPGIPRIVGDTMPINMQTPGSEDNANVLITGADEAHMASRTEPPDYQMPSVNEFSAVARDGTRMRGTELEHDIRSPEALRHDELSKQVQELWQFNRENIVLGEKGTERLEQIARDRLKQPDMVAVIPGLVEPEIGAVARYHSELLLPGHVFVVSKHIPTLESAAAYADYVINEEEVFQHVNIKALIEMGILPNNRYIPLFGKGTTSLPGWLYGMAMGIISDSTHVIQSDSDVVSFDERSPFFLLNPEKIGKIPPYRCPEYLALALALMPASYEAGSVQPAKVGPERKSEFYLPGKSYWASSEDRKLRMAGRGIGMATWNSASESITLVKAQSVVPWQVTTTFDIYRYLTAYYAQAGLLPGFLNLSGEEIPYTGYAWVEIQVPPPKIEHKPVPEERDVNEVVGATLGHTHAEHFFHELAWRQQFQPGGLPPELPPGFTIDHLKEYNARHAGIRDVVYASSPPEMNRDEMGVLHYTGVELFKRANKPIKITRRWRPFFLPSIRWMDENGLIDWDGIRKVKNYSTRSQKSKMFQISD